MKRLTKDSRNAKLAGVCAGVANYFEVDPTLVRVAWFVSAWFFGVGIFAYIVSALIMPEG